MIELIRKADMVTIWQSNRPLTTDVLPGHSPKKVNMKIDIIL